jgi:deoxyadenosine/deoxycytidine kinase
MSTKKPILIIAGHLGTGKTTMTEAISEIMHKHPECIVVNSLDEAKLLDVNLEDEKERGILINPTKKFEENLITSCKMAEPMPQIKFTHNGEQIKSARNIRREKQRKNKRK